jgi:hypothetical protein
MLGAMKRETYKGLGLAAVILLAPGGFILGATLAANHYRKRLTRRPSEPAPSPALPPPSADSAPASSPVPPRATSDP